MMTLPFVSPLARGGALAALLAGVTACAPNAQTAQTPLAGAQPGTVQNPVLLSCPTGQQPLLRQVVVNGAPVPQVECVTATAGVPAMAQVGVAPQMQPMSAPAVPTYAAPVVPQAYAAPAPVVYVPEPVATPTRVVRTSSRPAARRTVYVDDDVIEYKKRRSWQKSALIIGSSAGVGAGIGAATGGKKGALIGAAVGGGAATVWDQVTRR